MREKLQAPFRALAEALGACDGLTAEEKRGLGHVLQLSTPSPDQEVFILRTLEALIVRDGIR